MIIERMQVYKHYKGGKYIVISLGVDTTDLLPMVIYQSLDADETYWIRPLSEFLQLVDIGGGKLIPRFTLIRS